MHESMSTTDATALAGLASLRAARSPAGLPQLQPRSRAESSVHRLDEGDLAEILEELDTGVIVCCEEGRLQLANNAARRELLRGQPLAMDSTGLLRLCESAQPALRQWQTALRAAVQLRHRQMLALNDGTHRLMVSVVPLASRASRALVMLGRRQPAPDLAVEMLAKLYALTSAEQQVLVGLLAGQRVEGIAAQRGVTVATLRSQVGSLREKLGAGRLEDLVRLAAGLPPMSSVLRSPPLRPGLLAA